MTDSDLDLRLLNEFQRDVPIVARPFVRIGQRLGLDEDAVLARLAQLRDRGMVTRFGATCRPNTAGASTLAAVAAPPCEVDRIAAIINAQAGVNHSYLRENDWNIWFVVTGPDRAHVTGVLRRIAGATGLRVLDLRLIEAFNIDLGFDLTGASRPAPAARPAAPLRQPGPKERRLLQALSSGLPIVSRPFAALQTGCGLSEPEALTLTRALVRDGFVTRFGIIVRHRALGWRANAMVVWQVPPDRIRDVGPRLAALTGVTLCYQRRAVPGVWPYTLYNMIHGRTRPEALAVLERARQLPGLEGVPHEILFSLRCFRQTGALIEVQAREDAR